MKIGIVSDTHDNLTAIREAVAGLQDHGVEHVIHAGDFIAPFSLAPLQDLGVPVTAVFGNNDGERLYLKVKFVDYGWTIEPKFAFLELAGRKLAVHHEPEPVAGLAASGLYDVVIYGHTHQRDIRQTGGALIINPGEVCGWVTGQRSCVVLDLSSLEPTVIEW